MGYKKSETSTAQIIDAAARVIARQGYAHTSLMDIATEAGMSKGAVHYHYPSKEMLIGEVLERTCAIVAERTQAAWNQGGNPIASMRAALRELWNVRCEPSEETAVVADLIAQSLHDETLRPRLAEYYRLAASQVVEHLVPQLQALGIEPQVDMQLLPRILNGLLDGLMMQQLVEPGVLDKNQVIQTLETLALLLFSGQGSGPK